MDVSQIQSSNNDLMQILMTATQQQTDMAQKLIAVGAENTINENQLETMGNLVDTYA